MKKTIPIIILIFIILGCQKDEIQPIQVVQTTCNIDTSLFKNIIWKPSNSLLATLKFS